MMTAHLWVVKGGSESHSQGISKRGRVAASSVFSAFTNQARMRSALHELGRPRRGGSGVSVGGVRWAERARVAASANLH